MENDPYGYATDLEREAVKVMSTGSLAAFERAVKIFFDAKAGTDQTRHRWGEVLRAIYGQQQNADAYVAVCRADSAFGQGLSCPCRHAPGAQA